ncbi:MAG: tRNA lysidine(34) synthetase TilS [bacterium]
METWKVLNPKGFYLCTGMLAGFKKFIRKETLFRREDRILLAVSGGLDSVVMTDLFHQSGLKFAIAHCNFKLRGKESDRDERFVMKLAKRYEVPFFVQSFPTKDYSKNMGISVQMAARELRYAWFEEILVSQGYRYVATAHHLDDQAETFFINLLRGTGISGLHGILPKQGSVIRPMLFTGRDEIMKFAGLNHVTYREDSSNRSDKYLRNRIRRQVIPLLKKINPDFPSAIKETIMHLREFEEIGNNSVEEIRKRITRKEKNGILIDIDALRKLTPQGTFAWELLSPFGFNKSVTDDILASLGRNPGKIFFSPTHRLTRDRETLILETIEKDKAIRNYAVGDFISTKKISVPIPLIFRKIKKSKETVIPTSRREASLDLGKIIFPLIIRRWEPGDSFHPFGMERKKKISRFFIDEKFSLPNKEKTWLLCSGEKILWVIGHRIDHRFRVTSHTSLVLRITSSG